MRLLLTADLQLGAGTSFGTPTRPRLHDNVATLVELSALADRLDVDNVIVAGDVFQHRRPSIDELIVFRNWLDSCPVEVLLVAGNHDVRGTDVPATIDLFGEEGVNVFTRPGIILPGVVALPWAHPAAMRQAGYGSDAVAEALVHVARGLREKMRDSDYAPTLVTHYALSGMSTPTGFPTDELREPVLDTLALSEAGFDYIVAGHVHKPELDSWTTDQGDAIAAVSIGAPWRHDFGEASIEPGAWLLDTKTRELEHRTLDDRAFLTLNLESVMREDDEELMTLGPPADVAGAIVRVNVKVREDNVKAVPVENIRRNLTELGAHRVFVHLDVERSVRARSDVAEDSEPLAAVEAWVSATSTPIQEGERLRELTAKLLTEES